MTGNQLVKAKIVYELYFNDRIRLINLLYTNHLEVHESTIQFLKMLFSEDASTDEVLFHASLGSDELRKNATIFEEVLNSK